MDSTCDSIYSSSLLVIMHKYKTDDILGLIFYHCEDADTDGDGKVNIDEFKAQILSHSVWSFKETWLTNHTSSDHSLINGKYNISDSICK